jgi:hypothetical protein
MLRPLGVRASSLSLRASEPTELCRLKPSRSPVSFTKILGGCLVSLTITAASAASSQPAVPSFGAYRQSEARPVVAANYRRVRPHYAYLGNSWVYIRPPFPSYYYPPYPYYDPCYLPRCVSWPWTTPSCIGAYEVRPRCGRRRIP